MIIQEPYGKRYDGVALTRTYSDAGYRIRLDGTNRIYDEVVDPTYLNRTYTETAERIEPIPAPDGLDEAAKYMLQTKMVQIPNHDDEPDYFNESEPDPNYFEEANV